MLNDKAYRNARVFRWRLEIEDYAPKFCFIDGECNKIADGLSRLPIDPIAVEEENFNIVEDCFVMMPEWRNIWQPITLKEIGEKQHRCSHTIENQGHCISRGGTMWR